MKKILLLIAIVSALFSIEYTQKEKEFLKNHPVIYFSAMEYWPIDSSGNSIHTNYIKLLNKYGNLNIQPIYYKYWSEGFNAAKTGKTYGIMALSFSKKRTKYFFYTPSYNYTPYYLIVKKNSSITSFKDLLNKTVYIAKDSIIREDLKNTKIKIVWTKRPYKDLVSGKIDAILTFYMPPTKYVKKLRVIKAFINKSGEEHIGINKKYPELYSIIMKTMKIIPYDEIAKIKEKYYYNPMPPVTVITPKLTLKELIKPLDFVLIVFSISFLFLLIYLYFTRKYLNLHLKKFLIGIFAFESIILGLIVYEVVMFNYYSNKIIKIKSRSFNELFILEKVENSIIKLNNEYERKLRGEKTKYDDFFAGHISANNLKILNTTLKKVLTTKYFHPAALDRVAAIKIILQKIINLQKAVLNKKADISLYTTMYNYMINQIDLVINYIKNENDKEMSFIKQQLRYQFILLISISLIFIFSNILLFIMIKKKIYVPIKTLIDLIQRKKAGEKISKDYYYDDEVGMLFREFFGLHSQLDNTIEELQKHKKNLEEQVKEEVFKRTHHEQLLMKQSRLAIMGEMIDTIAHQWKQPLNSIMLLSDVLKLEKEKFTKEEIAKNIKTQVNHMSKTIDTFRSFFNETDKKEELKISEIINEVILLLKDTLIKHNIQINIDIKEDFKILGNKNELEHILISIIANARDIFEQRNIDHRVLNIKTKEENGKYYLLIEDNAGGIDNKIIDKIFDLRFTTRKSGSGIGLYLARLIAKKHKAKLYAKNSINGAVFVMEIDKK